MIKILFQTQKSSNINKKLKLTRIFIKSKRSNKIEKEQINPQTKNDPIHG